MTEIKQHHADNWNQVFSQDTQADITHSLEAGSVIFLPRLSFALSEDEKKLLTTRIASPKSKNVSYIPRTARLRGHRANALQAEVLTGMMRRYTNYATRFIKNMLPHYENALQLGRTSFRPIEVSGRIASPKKDDTRLHVDAFPSTPMQNKRILRIFTNINPEDKPRIWHLGERFENVCEKFLPLIKPPAPVLNRLLYAMRVTKKLRSPYDHYMLSIHDKMKLDIHYQRAVEKTRFAFPAASSWVVYTDIVSHAALEGQFLLEQTFYLPYTAMLDPEISPQMILEKKTEKKLLLKKERIEA